MDIRLKTLAAFFCSVILIAWPVRAQAAEGTPDEGVITLRAEDAFSYPDSIVLEPEEPPYNLGGWTAKETVYFTFNTDQAGWYEVILNYSKADYTGQEADIEVYPYDLEGHEPLESIIASLPATGPDWSGYVEYSAGYIYLERGEMELDLSGADMEDDDYLINLRDVTLRLSEDPGTAERLNFAGTVSEADYFEPSKRVYDDADIFTSEQEAALNGELNKISAAAKTHFIIKTTEGNTSFGFIDFAEDFYQENIRGIGGVYDCAMLTIDMSIRELRLDGYGELRQMVSDDEWTAIRERLTPGLTDGDYSGAAQIFMDDSYRLISEKHDLYNIEVPEADPSVQLYDYAGVLNDTQFIELSADIKDISEKLKTDYIIVICEEEANEDYLKRYASSFYRKNFSDAGRDGVYIMAVSPGGGAVSVSPFGAKHVTNDGLRIMNNDLGRKLSNYSVYAACQYFLFQEAEQWEYERLEIPDAEPGRIVYDYGDVLTDAQENSLMNSLNSVSEKQKVSFNVLTTEYWSYTLASGFASEFMSKNGAAIANGYSDTILIVLSARPEIEGEYAYVSILTFGDKPDDKIGYRQSGDIEYAARTSLQSDWDYVLAAEICVEGASKALNSIIPKTAMSERFPQIAMIAILSGLALPVLVIIILRIIHGFGMKRQFSASSYLASGSLSLTVNNDVFISTHTSRTKRSQSSSSSGSGSGGGGSSGSGSSSGSQGSF